MIVTSVLAVLVVSVLIIAAVVVYRRFYQKHSDRGNYNSTDASGQGQENNGLDEEYNTIPADYEVTPNDSSHVYSSLKQENEQKSSKIASNDSKKYSTIVLSNEKEEENSGYDGYNKVYHRKTQPETDSENLHTYSHMVDTSDDYNKLKTVDDKNITDNQYSHFESESGGEYSHLNDKNKPKTSDDYNHLQLNGNQLRLPKRIDSYEQPVYKIGPDVEHSHDISDNYETPVNLKQHKHSEVAITEEDTKIKLKRVDSYEQPVFRSTKEKDSDQKVIPKMNEHLKCKRIDSYEEPVLKRTTDKEGIDNDETKSGENLRDDYEKPVNFKTSVNDSISNAAGFTDGQRFDSCEQPVLMGTRTEISGDKDKSYNGDKPCDNYEKPLSIKQTDNRSVINTTISPN